MPIHHLALALLAADLTFTCPATRLRDVVAKLGELTAQDLKVAASLESRFAVVRFDNTPSEQALKRVADAFGAEWTTSGASRVLQPLGKGTAVDSGLIESVRKYLKAGNLDTAWSEKDADLLIKRALELGEQSDNSPGKWQKIRELESNGPRSRFVRRLARLIGEQAFLSIPKNGRIVYSTQPTRMQRAFPAGFTGILDLYTKESTLHHEALQRKGVTPESASQGGYYLQILQPRRGVIGEVKSVMLSITRSLGSIGMELSVKDSNDSEVSGMEEGIPLAEQFSEPGQAPKIEVEGDYKPSAISSLLSRALRRAMSGSRGESLKDQDLKETLAFFSDLEANELLRFGPSEVLLQVAAALDKDLVASVTDLSLIAYSIAEPDNTPLKAFLQNRVPWSISQDENGLTLTSVDSNFGIDLTLPRRQMSSFVRSVSRTGVTIDALADLVTVTPNDETAQFILMLACVPFQSDLRSSDFFQGQSALRLYGHLDPQSRAKARQSGFTTAYRTLSPALRAQLNEYVFNEAKTVRNDEPDIDASHVYSMGIDPEQDTTTLLPNGVPPDTLVTFRVRKEDRLFTVSTYGEGYTSTEATNEDEAASRLAWAERSRGAEGYASSLKFALGPMERLDVMVHFEPKSFLHTRFSLIPQFRDDQLKELADLPEAHRKSLEEKLAKQREQLKDVPVGTVRPPKIKP